MNSYVIGAKVKLHSGGPVMTIVAVKPLGRYAPLIGPSAAERMVSVAWFVESVMHTGKFPESALEVVG